jgi:hypothetical protein
VNAVSLKITDQILAEYYGLFGISGIIMDYCGILLDYWNILEYYWIIGIFWNIMEYYGLLPNLYTQIIVASPRF